MRGKLARAHKLRAYVLPVEGTAALAALAARNMELHFNMQDATVFVSSDDGTATVTVQPLER